jgi:glycosyltransferase involved in cell wall biosynthesis
MFMREGAICEDCIGKLPWRGILRRCYRDSAAQSAVLVGMLGVHRALGTFRRHVDCYIALNGFCRDKFVQAGLPVERIAVKPNFVDLPAPDFVAPRAGALYVGRLSPEKGIRVLAEAAASRRGDPIEVIGTGPAGDGLEQASGVALLGPRTQPEIYARMRGAAYLVLPSVWYENFPRVLVEAFACGLPVIASRLGAMAELIADRVTGLLFNPGDPRDLAAKMRWADAHPEILQRMGRAARDEYQHRYTPEVNFAQLAGIYEQAMRPNDFRSGAAKAPAPNKVIAETN